MSMGVSRKTNLFVSRLPYNLSEQSLKEAFSKYGTVRSMLVKRPNVGSVPIMTTAYCIAYVDFETEKEAKAAIEGLNNTMLSGSQISVDFYDRKTGIGMSLNNSNYVVGTENLRTLFIKGIDKKVSDLSPSLETLFESQFDNQISPFLR